MSDNGHSNPTVVRTSRGLTVEGSRLTIYLLMDHFKAGDSDDLVREWYRLTPEQLENIALYEVEVDMRYDPSYDNDAQLFEIGGGEMLHWPLNAPHRVENLDCLNVSMTTEYWTEAIRRKQMITMANGILRHKAGLAPKSQATAGATFWAKAAPQWAGSGRTDRRLLIRRR